MKKYIYIFSGGLVFGALLSIYLYKKFNRKNYKSLPPNINKILDTASKKYKVDPTLIRAIAWKESRGNSNAISNKGAIGLMQLLPKTAISLGVKDIYDPQENANGGAKFISQLLKQYGDLTRVLAAYNWGQGNVNKNKSFPSSVKTYIKEVLDRKDWEQNVNYSLKS